MHWLQPLCPRDLFSMASNEQSRLISAEGKKSFSIPHDAIHVVNLLSNEEAGLLIKHIFEYAAGNRSEHQNRLVDVAFEPIRQFMEEKWSHHNAAEKHWNWKGGITPENRTIRNSTAMKNWRMLVFIRDNFTCQKCGQVGGKLQAHHIREFSKYSELRFEVDNGLTLCKSCHKKEHSTNG